MVTGLKAATEKSAENWSAFSSISYKVALVVNSFRDSKATTYDMMGIVLKSGGLQERTASGNEFALSTARQVKFPGGLAKPK